MWEPRFLTTPWAFTACCMDSFTFYLQLILSYSFFSFASPRASSFSSYFLLLLPRFLLSVITHTNVSSGHETFNDISFYFYHIPRPALDLCLFNLVFCLVKLIFSVEFISLSLSFYSTKPKFHFRNLIFKLRNQLISFYSKRLLRMPQSRSYRFAYLPINQKMWRISFFYPVETWFVCRLR
jgi:hypothetical protein